jgi:hypothetical protein
MSVTIGSGELPSAVGVNDPMALRRVLSKWKSIADGRFQEDCRALKQMIEETDALRLWERDDLGRRYSSRDDFLRRGALIDYELTERDFIGIVSALRSNEPEKAAAAFADAQATAHEAYFEAFLRMPVPTPLELLHRAWEQASSEERITFLREAGIIR